MAGNPIWFLVVAGFQILVLLEAGLFAALYIPVNFLVAGGWEAYRCVDGWVQDWFPVFEPPWFLVVVFRSVPCSDVRIGCVMGLESLRESFPGALVCVQVDAEVSQALLRVAYEPVEAQGGFRVTSVEVMVYAQGLPSQEHGLPDLW